MMILVWILVVIMVIALVSCLAYFIAKYREDKKQKYNKKKDEQFKKLMNQIIMRADVKDPQQPINLEHIKCDETLH